MNEKTLKLKKSLIGSFVVSLTAVVLALASIILVGYFKDGTEMWNQLINQLTNIKEAILLVVDQGSLSPTLVETYGDDLQLYAILGCTYLVAVLVLFALVYGIVRVCLKKRPAYIPYALVILLTALVSAFMVSNTKGYEELVGEYFEGTLTSENSLALVILSLAVMAFAAIALITTIITFVEGLIYARKTSECTCEECEGEELPAEEVGQPVLAEEAIVPECVQESEELPLVTASANEFVPEVEPEPELETINEEDVPVSEPVEPTPAIAVEEPAPEVTPEPAPVETKTDDRKVEVNVNAAPAQSAPAIDTNSLASLLREVVRDIVRDELARNQVNQPVQPQQTPSGCQQITGATFGGPLVVQYFNGGINGVNPAQITPTIEQKPVEAAPAPVVSEPVQPAPAVSETVEPAPVVSEPAPTPVVSEPAPVAPVEEKKEEKVYERLTFAERLLQSDKELHTLYNLLKNEILSYGVKSRVSAIGDTFRLHKKMYVRITVAGKSLKLYFALDPKDYENSTIPVQDASGKALYEEIPLVFKVKSDLSVRRAKELIQAVMEQDSLEQGEIGKVNWVKELKAELASGKKEEE